MTYLNADKTIHTICYGCSRQSVAGELTLITRTLYFDKWIKYKMVAVERKKRVTPRYSCRVCSTTVLDVTQSEVIDND